MIALDFDSRDTERTRHMRAIDKRIRRTDAQILTCADPELRARLVLKQQRRRQAFEALCCCRSFAERSLAVA